MMHILIKLINNTDSYQNTFHTRDIFKWLIESTCYGVPQLYHGFSLQGMLLQNYLWGDLKKNFD